MQKNTDIITRSHKDTKKRQEVRGGINTKYTKFKTDKDTKFLGMFFVNFLLINFVTFVFNLFGLA